jgi:hypothetical protein
MSLSPEMMLELMQYADGELDEAARERVEALLRANEEARGVVEAMGALGEVVREGVEDRAATHTAADGIADGVMAALLHDAGVGQGGGVVPIDRARPARRARTGMTSAGVAAFALAAGVFLFVTTKAPAPVAKEDPVPSAPPTVESPAAAAPEAVAAVAAVAKGDVLGVDLEEVRSIRNKVNVFFVPPPEAPGSPAAASVVVWIDDRHGGQ